MRAPFMGGRFPFPVKYGYATVGRVEQGPAALVGRTVFTLHPHQTLFDVPAAAAVPVSAGVPARRARPRRQHGDRAQCHLGCASPGPPGRIAVVGAGVVGALVALLCAQASRRRGDAGRHRPGACRHRPRVSASSFAAPDARAAGLRLRRPRQRQRGGSGDRARSRRRRGDRARAELVRRRRRRGAARRGVPQPPAQAYRQPGRQGGAVAAGRAGPIASGSKPRSRCSPIHGSTRCSRRPIAFDDLPARLPDILGAKSGVLCQRRFPTH